MAKRWKEPCRLCKGTFRRPCIMCGWSAKNANKPVPMKDLTPLEQADRRGKRNKAEFLHGLDCSMTRSNNHTVDDLKEGSELSKEEARKIDERITEHREFALSIYKRHKEGENYKSIAEQEELTVSIVKRIVQLVSDKLVRGIFELEPKPATKSKFPPPPIEVPNKRAPIKWQQ